MGLRLHARDGGDDRGIAMVMVLGSAAVLTGLVFATTAVALNANALGRADQDDQAALRAAEAGVDDYLDRLNSDNSYYAKIDCTNLAMKGPQAPEGTCLRTPALGTRPVPGRTNSGSFHYSAITADTVSTGAIVLLSTGYVPSKVGEAPKERTLRVTLRRSSFLDFLYFSDKETTDTQLQSLGNQCDAYRYAGRPSGCTTIRWVTADTVLGPLHTNDTLVVDGAPQFKGRTSTGWNDSTGKNWLDFLGSGSTPNFQEGGKPFADGVVNLPSTNANIRRQTDAAFTSTPGCRYYGPTRIILGAGGPGKGNGTMTVFSPRTTTAQLNPGCSLGTPGPLPRNGVVYVDPAPATTVCDNAAFPYVENYPQPGDVGTVPTYKCRDANVFVSGVLDGQLSIASEHNVIVVDHTTYESGTCNTCTDVLGLIGTQYVWVYHPVRRNSSNATVDMPMPGTTNRYLEDIRIEAAVASNLHSFMVQNHDKGSPRTGALNVTGAITQKFRGPVGTSSGPNRATGYAKNYVYDNRLKILSPPFYLAPEVTKWQARDYSEQ